MLARLASWRTLKSGVLLFWAAWFTIVLITNVCDALKAGRVLPSGWTFSSGNWELMLKATAGLLFWRAWAAGGRGGVIAFVVGLALWATFALADEVFLAYTVEAAHLRLFGLQLVSVLALRLLP